MPEHDEEDFLTEDPEISSQKVVLLSFLSPEKILADKDLYFFTDFMNDYNLQWRTSRFEGWLAEQVNGLNTKIEALAGKLEAAIPEQPEQPEQPDVSGALVTPQSAAKELRQNLFRVDRLIEEYQDFTRKNQREIQTSTIQEDYQTFMYKNEDKLEEVFFKKNDFHTTMRGIKVRGVYSSTDEAQARAKRLQKSDPSFNIYLGHVGKWMAWEPNPDKVGDQEYANEQLNTLMKKYRENEENREVFYNEQKKTRMGATKTKEAAEVAPEVKLTETESGLADTPFASAATAGTSYDGLFSEQGDLAIRRKMENRL